MSLLSIIRRPAATAAELRAKLDKLRAADPLPARRDLELERRRLLFEGDDKAVERVEAQLAAHSRDVARFTDAVAELERQLAAAEIAENQQALTAQRDAVAKEADAVAKQLKAEYPKLANGLISLLTRLKAAEVAVADVNAKLALAGRDGERIAAVEWRAFPAPEKQYAPPFSLLVRTTLRAIAGITPGWNQVP
jgi:hypothetical protein